jgi:hypothetical protein
LGIFTGDRVYNLDETGILTVVQDPSVVTELGSGQVDQAVSRERGTIITVCMIVNTVGNAIPPVFIFPRARFHDTVLFGAPPEILGLLNSPQWWDYWNLVFKSVRTCNEGDKREERRYSSYSFSNSALDGGEWLESRSNSTLTPGKGPPAPTVEEAGWAPELVWTQRLEEKSFHLCRGSNLDCPVVQPIARHCIV